jgi:heme-degrading monooxygenase HmoA
MEQIFIDRFILPESAEPEFKERMAISRDFIKELPGFVRDEAYMRRDGEGNIFCVTMAIWESEAAINVARELVQAEYKRTNFNMPAMMQRLGVQMERGQYQELEH